VLTIVLPSPTASSQGRALIHCVLRPLTQIHTRHLGDDADASANKARRVMALRAFEGLIRETPSRHHQLELLADALGVATP
jgi:hypothetical protein